MIEHLLKKNPEFHLVGKVNEGTQERRTWVHIRDGQLLGTTEISGGILGGSTTRPVNFSSVNEAYKYFSERGVPKETFEKIIQPNLGIEQSPSEDYH